MATWTGIALMWICPLLLLMDAAVCNGAGCTKNAIDTCVAKFLSSYTREEQSPIVPAYTESQLDQRCRDYDAFEDCIQDFKQECDESVQLTFIGYEAYYDYLCREAKHVYLRNRACLNDTQLHAEGRDCSEVFNNKVEELTTGDPTVLRDRICLYIETYLDCVENAVFAFCHKEVADFQRELDRRSVRPTLQRYRCKGWEATADITPSDKSWLKIGIPVLAALLGIGIVILIVCLVRRNKARKEVRRRMQAVTADQPPPYTVPPMVYSPATGQVAPTEPVAPPAYSSALGAGAQVTPGTARDDHDQHATKPTTNPPAYSTYNRLPVYGRGGNHLSDRGNEYPKSSLAVGEEFG